MNQWLIVKEATKYECHIVETDDEYRSTYRRNGKNSWERLYGETWEPVWNDEEIEKRFDYIKDLVKKIKKINKMSLEEIYKYKSPGDTKCRWCAYSKECKSIA
jgi:hypothetical protein